MEIKYTISLFIIFSLILSVLLETIDLSTYKSNEDLDDYDYEEEIKLTTVTKSSTMRSTRRTATPSKQMYFADLDDIQPINPCPENCKCNKNLKLVNCTGLALIEIPASLPQDTRTIDLSYNSIDKIKDIDFANCYNIQNINLANNKLNSLSPGILKNLTNLNKLNISHNELPKINLTTFSNMPFLTSLDVSYNPIIFIDNEDLNWENNLNELYLEGCSITSFDNNSFKKLEKLTLLNVKDNPIIDDDLNVEIFRPLKMLSTLKISNITKNKTEKLCKILETVDKIETKNVTVSCYELMAGLEFEDSVIAIKMSTSTENILVHSKNTKFDQKNVYSQVNNSSNDITIPFTTTDIIDSPLVLNESEINNSVIKENHSSLQNTIINDQAIASSDYINHVLIGIIVICCIGLITGLLCRADVCGIKTKCCRTKQPQNHNTPIAEEVPLNRVILAT